VILSLPDLCFFRVFRVFRGSIQLTPTILGKLRRIASNYANPEVWYNRTKWRKAIVRLLFRRSLPTCIYAKVCRIALIPL
jgi:hypothetical protein